MPEVSVLLVHPLEVHEVVFIEDQRIDVDSFSSIIKRSALRLNEGAGCSGSGSSGAGVSGDGVSGAGVSGAGVSGAGASGAGVSGAGFGALGVGLLRSGIGEGVCASFNVMVIDSEIGPPSLPKQVMV